eukprot:488872-Amorphochlora_amoeboformis.AAC.1
MGLITLSNKILDEEFSLNRPPISVPVSFHRPLSNAVLLDCSATLTTGLFYVPLETLAAHSTSLLDELIMEWQVNLPEFLAQSLISSPTSSY